jgi:hypothetical protein
MRDDRRLSAVRSDAIGPSVWTGRALQAENDHLLVLRFCIRPIDGAFELLAEEHDSVRTWGDLGCNFVEMELHGFAVAGRQHEGGAGPAFGADSTEQVGRLGALIVSGART